MTTIKIMQKKFVVAMTLNRQILSHFKFLVISFYSVRLRMLTKVLRFVILEVILMVKLARLRF
jgi:predicted phosphatase